MTPDDDATRHPEAEETGPRAQFLAPENVLDAMCRFGAPRVERTGLVRLLVLGALGGAFITVGAMLSLLLSEGVEPAGPKVLLAGLGFSGGFFFVVLSHAALFTEANVVLPAVMLHRRAATGARTVARYWAVVWVGNLLGAVVAGAAIVAADVGGAGFEQELASVLAKKTVYAEAGTWGAWGAAVLSGVLANWLVGMAAFFAFMGRTIPGKFLPVALAVTAFVGAGFQHSPANMGYFAMAMPLGLGPGWGTALGWNIVPAGLGNMIGGALLVALPFWFALPPARRRDAAARLHGRASPDDPGA